MKTNRLAALLYVLIRDKIPPGEMEAFVRDAEKTEITAFRKDEYSNRDLANYAQKIALRLMRAPRKPTSEKQREHLEKARQARMNSKN